MKEAFLTLKYCLLFIQKTAKNSGDIQIYNDEYKNVILSKLEGTYPEYPYGIVRSVIIGIINNEFPENIIFDKEDILNIAINSLHNLLNYQENVNQQHIELLYSCISNINQSTRIVVLDKGSCSTMKQHIMKNPLDILKILFV